MFICLSLGDEERTHEMPQLYKDIAWPHHEGNKKIPPNKNVDSVYSDTVALIAPVLFEDYSVLNVLPIAKGWKKTRQKLISSNLSFGL